MQEFFKKQETMLLYIDWNVNPTIFEIGPLSIRWYGLMFAIGFLIGYKLIENMFLREKMDITTGVLDSLLLYVFAGTVIGARFGHVVFWEWDYYSQHLIEIPQIWKGGLASHGAMVILPLILWFFSAKIIKKPALWLLDRIAIAVAMTGGFIRLGNLFNHEIVGKETESAWGFIFRQCYNCGDVARHPVQLYESFSYFIIFAIMMFLYWRTDLGKKRGFLFGFFLTTIFGMRFLLEYFKRHFIGVETNLMETYGMNLGQILSIPAVLLGIYLMLTARKRLMDLPY
ncbi:MAG: phosphatidylglycerol:prolipoprotein diacylglycerol transferase [Cognaticolwellia sp.]